MMSSVETVPKESKKDSSNDTTHSEGNNLQDYANNGTVASNATTYTHASGNPVSSVASDQHPNSLAFIPAHSAAALQMPYSPFPAGDGSWTTPPFDPNLMAGFSFTGPNMIAPGHLQNQFYFPGADMGIWGQEPLANQLLMSYSLLSPVAMDQTGNAVPLDATGVANSVDPISGLGQTFSGIALNGSMPGMMMGQAPLMSTTSSSSGSLEDVGQSSGSVPNPGQMSNAPQPEKPKSWAAIASQPAKPRPPPPPKPQPQPETFQEVTKKPQTGTGMNRGGPSTSNKGQGQGTGAGKGGGMRRTAQQQQSQQQPSGAMKAKSNQSNIVGKLQSENKYNPSDLTLSLNNARFFVIKSYAEDDIHRSIKYNIWTSTEHGNRRLDQAFRELNGKGNMYLFYSVNGSGHFCGMAQMTSGVDFNTTTGVWAQDKWKGRIEVKWIYVKDVPNSQLRHIRLENNENKPVTNSRDTQEIPMEKGKQVIKIVHNYHHTTSIFDDFEHYEKKQEEEESRKKSS